MNDGPPVDYTPIEAKARAEVRRLMREDERAKVAEEIALAIEVRELHAGNGLKSADEAKYWSGYIAAISDAASIAREHAAPRRTDG
jgi:hypothetical protein